ncbi:MAG TPA: type II toxin-antitoxin system death-on-curing family toxin [Xanthobacteraceae bacterium]|nr:type II toxin-antitoxin system death-on-curing family toxin [Xanthobacteraceae bacterium]
MAADEPIWLTPENVVDINAEIVEASGEAHFLRNRGLLESAVARPQNTHVYGSEADIVSLAFVLLLGIGKNHPFEQGNKRTGFLAAIEMLKLNGYEFDAPNSAELGEVIEQAIEGLIDEDDFIETMREFVVSS